MSDAQTPKVPVPLAARWLNLLQGVAPTFGSSFYAKAKLVKRLVPPNPSTVVLDIIRQCSFGCEFCFAGNTQCQGDYTPLARLEPVLSELRGIGKLTLIGGEPFEHPELPELLRRAWEVASDEVEIFTNGAAFPDDPQAAATFLAPLLPPPGRRLRLTLAADVWHRRRHGAARFEHLVSLWLELHRRSLITAMFNVTDSRIYTTHYVDRPTIRAVFEELSPALWRHFERLADQGRVDDAFYLNPLIVQGRQGDAPGAECLRAADFAYHPEVVLTDRPGGLRLVRALNAAWMTPVPEALDLGNIEEGLAQKLRDGIVGPRLGADLLPWLLPALGALLEPTRREELLGEARRLLELRPHKLAERLFDAVLAVDEQTVTDLAATLCDDARFALLRNDPRGYTLRQVDWMEAVALRDPPQAPIELNGRQDVALIRLESLRVLLERLEARGGVYGALDEPLRLWRILVEDATRPTPCLHITGPGLRAGDAVPLVQTRLHTGHGYWPDDSEPHAVWPSLRAQSGGLVAGISGLELRPLGIAEAARRQSIARFLDYHLWLFGGAGRKLLERMRRESPGDYVELLDERLNGFDTHPANDPARLRPTNLWDLFTEATFDPTRNRPSLERESLLRLLIDSDDYPGYEQQEVLAFKQRLCAWLERLSDPA